MEKKSKTITLEYFRGLIIRQKASCAITGLPLHPKDVNADHIIPLSRTELNPSQGEDNIWLVDKKVNAMKGAMTYDELLEMCKLIIENENKSKILLNEIKRLDVKPISKIEFDKWVTENCDDNGVFK